MNDLAKLKTVRRRHKRVFKEYMRTKPFVFTTDKKVLTKQARLAKRLADLDERSRRLGQRIKPPVQYP